MNFESMEIWNAMKETKYRRTLDELNKVIHNAHGNLNEAISAALDMTCAAIHAEAGTFWFYSRFGDGLIHPRAWYGGSNISQQYLHVGEGVAGKVVETGTPTIISDCQQDPRWAKKVDSATGFTTKSMICVPLKTEDMVYGCIQLINKMDNSLFDEKDLSFAQRLAEEISTQFVTLNLLSDGRVEPNIAVLFADIRGFTKLAETMSPAVVANLLNEYLVFVTGCIRQNGGIANKYIGDCVLAYWRPDEDCREPAYMACKAAMSMVEGAAEMRKRLKSRFDCEINFGVGIHYGEAYIGNIGTSVLTDHTVIGDTVNMASHLVSCAPAGKVLISHAVAHAVGKKAKTSHPKLPVRMKLKRSGFKFFYLNHLD